MHRPPVSVARFAAAVILFAALAPARAFAQSEGAWTVFLRPTEYSALQLEGDTLWCATRTAGLFLYRISDGSFQPLFRSPDRLASNQLSALAIGTQGSLWIGTEASGVSRLRPDRRTWTLVNAFDGLPSEAIRCLTPDPARDSLWIGTAAGIALWSGDQILGTLPDGVNPSPFLSDDILGIAVQSDSQFIATAAGAYLRRPSPIGPVVDTIGAGLPPGAVAALAAHAGDVLALVSGGVYRFNRATSAWVATPPVGTVYRLSASGSIVLASSSSGIHRWTGSAWQSVAPTLVSTGAGGAAYAATSAAPGGPLYAANASGVATVASPGATPVLASPEVPIENNLMNVYHDGARLYVSTRTSGISRFDGTRWRNWLPGGCGAGCDTTFTNPGNTLAMVSDKVGRVKWFASWGAAVDRMDDTGPVPAFTRPVWNDGISFTQHTLGSVGVVDSTNGIWLGMDTFDLGGVPPIGIDQYDSTGAFVRNLMPGENGQVGNGKIKALAVDRTNRLWVGHTGDGLQWATVPASIDSVPRFNTVAGTAGLDIRGLDVSGDTVWAATTIGVRTYQRANGNPIASYANPPNGSIDDLALNPIAIGADGRAWLGTNAGVRVFNRDGSIFADFTTLNSPLPGDVVRAIRVEKASGRVWIATSSGLARFDPFYTPPLPPPVERLEVRTFPNPASLSGAGAIIRLSGNAANYTGVIYDLGGRRVRRFGGVASGSVIWDGRDEDGLLVKPGVYFVRVEASGLSQTARIVLLR